jgi:hypothetical protein
MHIGLCPYPGQWAREANDLQKDQGLIAMQRMAMNNPSLEGRANWRCLGTVDRKKERARAASSVRAV